MKKTTLITLIALSSTAFADNVIRKEYDPKPMVEGNTRVQELIDWNKDHPGQLPPLTDQEKYEIFTKRGIPLPGNGASTVNINPRFKLSSSQSALINQFNADQKSKGYHEMDDKRVHALLSMPEVAAKEYNERKSLAYNPHDTHLYEARHNLQMNYLYQDVPLYLVKKVIGFAPESTFIDKGWAGAVEFFVPTFGGVCAYHEVNIQLTKSSAYIPEEIATYNVNNKLTKMNVVGSKENGFVYEIEWWDKRFKRSLECASKENYSVLMRERIIKLANNIDKA